MKAYEADRNIKTGLTEPETALELFVAGGLGTLQHRAEWSEIGEGAAGCGQKRKRRNGFI